VLPPALVGRGGGKGRIFIIFVQKN